MDLEDFKWQRQKIERDTTLTDAEKVTRLRVVETAIERKISNKKYKEKINEIVKDGEALTNISPSFSMYDTLDLTKDELNYKIAYSEIGDYIESRGIDDFTYDDFKDYVGIYEDETGKKVPDISLSCKLYDEITDAEKEEQTEMNIIKKGLSKIVDNNLLDNYVYEIEANGKIRMKHKTPEELDKSMRDAKEKIEELYVNEGLLDREISGEAREMLTTLFNYYKNGSKKLPKKIETGNPNTNGYQNNTQGKKM